MNKTKNTFLFVLLVLQVGLIAFFYRPGQNTAPAAANLFPALPPEQLSAMTITDDQGKTITLLKKEGWQISQGEFPADRLKIEGLLKKFADMKSSRLVSQSKSSHARLKVADADFNRKVELTHGEAKTVFFLGTSPSSKSIHLRLAEAKEVYQINDLAAWELQADKESWWQLKYVNQPAPTLTGVTIANSHGTIELANDAQKGWQLKAAPDVALDNKRVATLMGSLLDVNIASYQAKDFAPQGQPQATVTYHGKDGATTLQIWAKDKPEDLEQIVKASNSTFYGKIKEYGIKEALEIKLEALKDKPSEPAAAGAALTAPPPPSEPIPPPIIVPGSPAGQ